MIINTCNRRKSLQRRELCKLYLYLAFAKHYQHMEIKYIDLAKTQRCNSVSVCNRCICICSYLLSAKFARIRNFCLLRFEFTCRIMNINQVVFVLYRTRPQNKNRYIVCFQPISTGFSVISSIKTRFLTILPIYIYIYISGNCHNKGYITNVLHI